MSATTIKRLDPAQVELELEIESDELERARATAFRDLVRNVRIPGFRPGKAPRKIFEAQYGTAQIEERAMNAVVPEIYSRALQENELDPLDQPQMELLPEEEGRPLRVRATVSVRPAIELRDYKGLALEGSAIEVGESDVEAALQELRRNAAILVPADRAVQFGDVPTLDYHGKIDGESFEGGQAEGQPTEMLADRFIPGFAPGIVGMLPGETKDVQARFPDDYGQTALAGKTATFTVTVQENKAAELPELDDEFAKRFGDTEATVATLRDDLRNRLEARAREAQRRELTDALLHKLAETHDVYAPALLVDREAERLMEEARGLVQRAGSTWEEYLRKEDTTEEQLALGYRKQGEQRVKTSLLVEAIAKEEHISATAADIEAEVQQLSRQYRRPREEILTMLRSNWNALVDGIVRTKTVEFLIDRAVVTETKAGSQARPAQEPAEPEAPDASRVEATLSPET